MTATLEHPTTRDRTWRLAVWGGAAFVLSLPWWVLPMTGSEGWKLHDFVLFGGMLLVACCAYELAAKVARTHAYRAASGVAIGAALLLVWMNLAVGIIGNENNPANLMFGGVIAVGVVGALLARLQPRGMARALVAMAIAQFVVAVVAQVAGHFTWILSGFYVALWLTSARLFRRAEAQQARAPRLC